MVGMQLQVFGVDRYVATNGNGTAGDSWTTAYTNLQQALNAAGTGDRLYVAGHQFVVTAAVTWVARNDLTLLGGYAATNPAQFPGPYDPVRWPTVLRRTSGSIRLLTLNNVTNAVIGRMSFSEGRFSSTGANGKGGALYLINCGPVMFADCQFTNNTCTDTSGAQGGALYTANTALTLSNCVFRLNAVIGSGNGAASGAALYAASGTVTLRDCVIAHNLGYSGWQVCRGAVYNNGATLQLNNCLVYGNQLNHEGDGLFLNGGSTVLANCTIADNAGYGIYRNTGSAWLTNCIVWANGDDVFGSSVTLAYSAVEDGDNNLTNGCIMTDPGFEYGYYLSAASASRDAGTGAAYLLSAPYTTRTNGTLDVAAVDMGYHYRNGIEAGIQRFYVATNGNDTWVGTSWPTAFRTIGKALQTARDGSTITIGTGVFTRTTEAFPLTIRNRAGIRILGMGPTQTMVRATGSNMRVWDLEHLTRPCLISGIGFGGGQTNITTSPHAGTADGGGLRIYYASDFSLLDCSITNNGCLDSTGAMGGGMYGVRCNLTVSNCTFRGNTAYGSGNGRGYGGGLALSYGQLRLQDSVLDANTADCSGHVLSYGGGFYAANSTVTLHNNLIMNNVALPGGDGLFATNSTLSVGNCTIAYNGDSGVNRGGTGTGSISNSIIWGNGDDIQGSLSLSYSCIEDGDNNGINGCTNANPQFEYGFFLAAGSPCIDRGGATAETVGLGGYTTRAVGTPDSGLVDMGYHALAGADLQYADVFVSTTGNDTWAGTNLATAVRTIGKGLAKVIDGGRVHVGAGRYTNGLERFPLTLNTRNAIWLLGAGTNVSIIDASGSNMRVFDFLNLGGNSGISGFTITGGKTNITTSPHAGTADGGAIRLQNCASFTLASCLVTNNQCTDSSGGMGGAIYVTGSSVVLTNCVFRRNTASGSGNGWGFGGAIAGLTGSQITIDRCIMETNRAVGHSYSRGGAIYGAAPVFMRNCLVFRNDALMLGDGLFFTNSSVTIESSTLVYNGGQGINRGGTGTGMASNCIVWANGDDVAGTGWTLGYSNIEDGDNNGINGCIQADPLFENPGTFDYRLAKASPCINRGMNQAWMSGSAIDLEGRARKQARVDMGCYEADGLGGAVFMIR